jgi:hypothetical protein
LRRDALAGLSISRISTHDALKSESGRFSARK